MILKIIYPVAAITMIFGCSMSNQSNNINKVSVKKSADGGTVGKVSAQGNPGSDSSNQEQNSDQQQAPDTNAQDGLALYKEHCERCHDPLDNSSKKGASVGRIKQGRIARLSAEEKIPSLRKADLV